MIRFLLRTLGLLSLAAAFVFLVYDGTRSISDNRLDFTRVEEVWSLVHPGSLQQLRSFLESHGPHWLWNDYLFGAPAFAALAVLGAILIPLGRRRRPLIGYAR